MGILSKISENTFKSAALTRLEAFSPFKYWQMQVSYCFSYYE